MSAAVEPAAAAPPSRANRTPYQGLRPYATRDAPYFFGRRADAEIVTANLIASRMTVLYAPSGVGKTSLLRAGVEHELLRSAREEIEDGERPSFVPAVARTWSGDPLAAIAEAVLDGAHALGFDVPVPAAEGGLRTTIDAVADETGATVLLILDQFEEFLLHHGEAWEPGTPAEQLVRLLAAPELPLHVLLSLREDALGALDGFRSRVPHLLDNQLRLRHLDARAGRLALTGPIERWNRDHPDDRWDIEPALVDRILEEVGAGRINLGRTGAGAVDSKRYPGVETPFMQVVMSRLWEEERRRGSHCLHLSTLDGLGGAAQLVAAHLDLTLKRLPARRRRVAAGIFHLLVTPGGRKVPQTVEDVAGYIGRPAREVAAVLDQLAGPDWLVVRRLADPDPGRPPQYEIFHDALAEPVLDWRARFERAQWRRRTVLTAAAAFFVAAGAIWAAWTFKQNADRADAAALAADARTRIATDPLRAVRTAAEAVRTHRSAEAVGALRAALAQADLRLNLRIGRGRVASFRVSHDGTMVAVADHARRVRVWRLDRPRRALELPVAGVESIDFSPDDRSIATGGSGGIETWSVRDGRRERRLSAAADVKNIRWSPDGDHLLAVRRDHPSEVWSLRTGVPRPIGDAGRGVWSRNGHRLATATQDGLVRIWSPEGRREAVLPGGGRISALSFTPDGSRALVVRKDTGTVQVSGAGGCARAGRGPVQDSRFSLDGRAVALAAEDGVRVVQVRNSRTDDEFCDAVILRTPPPMRPPGKVAISEDGRTVAASGDDGGVRVWDGRTQVLLTTLLGASRDDARLEIRRARTGGHVVLAAADDGDVRAWHVAAIPQAVTAERRRVRAAVLDGDGRRLLVATEEDLLSSAVSGRNRGEAVGELERAQLTRLSPTGRVLALATDGGDLVVRSPADGRSRRLGPSRSGADVVGMTLDRDGGRLLTEHEDGTARVWDTATGTSVSVSTGGGRSPEAVFAGDRVAVLADGVRLHDLETGDTEVVEDRQRRWTVAAGVAGRLVAAARRGAPRVWDLDRRGPPVRLAEARPPVRAVAVSPDGGVVATAEVDRLRLWDAGAGQELVTLALRRFDTVTFSADGGRLVVGGPDGAEVFPCRPCGRPEVLLAKAEALAGRAGLPPLAPLPVTGEAAPLARLGTAGDAPPERSAPDGEGGVPGLVGVEVAEPQATPAPDAAGDAVEPTATPQAAPIPGADFSGLEPTEATPEATAEP